MAKSRKIKCGGCTEIIIQLSRDPKVKKQLERQMGKKVLQAILSCER